MEHFEKCVKDGDNFGNLQFFCFVFFFNSLKLNVLECAAFPRRFGKLAPSRDRVVECALETRTQRRLGPAPSLWNWSQVFPSSVSRPRQQGNSSEAGRGGAGVGGGTFLGSISVDATGRITGTLLLLESPAGHVPMHFGSHRGSPLCAHHTEGHGSLTRCHGA